MLTQRRNDTCGQATGKQARSVSKLTFDVQCHSNNDIKDLVVQWPGTSQTRTSTAPVGK